MGKDVQVLFIKDKKGSYTLGQQKSVKLGYARNFLFPQGIAVRVNDENLAKINSVKKKAEKQQAQLEERANTLKPTLHEKTTTFVVKTHDEGKLYGSISAEDAVKQINKEFKTDIDKFDLKNFLPIKEAGTYSTPVHIHPNVSIVITINVESEPEKKSKKTTKKKVVTKKETPATDAPSETGEDHQETTSDN